MKLRPITWLLGALALFATTPLAAQRPSVDPLLHLLLRPEARQEMAAGAQVSPPGQPLVTGLFQEILQVRSDARGRPVIPVIVEVRDGRGVADLRALGAEIGSVVGGIVTAELPLESIERLLVLPTLRHVEAARSLQLVNEVSTTLVRANEVRAVQGGVWTGFAGQGVIVGVYDTGIDFLHQDFRHADGTTRILGLWDQTLTAGPPPTGFSYGRYCDPASLNDNTCPSRDTHGHGTHVAGSAAGNGRAVGQGGEMFRMAGVAPMADLLVVHGYQAGSFPVNRVVDGINWIFAEAERLGRPAVVNLSLGGQSGPRDGTALHEVAIDQLSGPGRIAVVAAGNAGQNGTSTNNVRLFHADVPGTPGPHTIGFQITAYTPTTAACSNLVGMEIWYGGTDRIRATVVRPDGSSFSAVTGEEGVFQAHPGGNIEFVLPEAPRPRNNDRTGAIWVDDCRTGSGAPQQGDWTIQYEFLEANSGKLLHTWINVDRLGGAERTRGTTGFDNAYVVASPGTATRAITVGSYTSRNSWTSPVGNFQITAAPPPGEISNFSSGGPSRDGRLKPEITAPGSVIMSSLSRFVPNPNEQLMAPGRQHIINQGTSMAAPHVAGGIAILLQRAGSLTPEQALQALATTAIQDEFTQRSYTQVPVIGQIVGHPNAQWGHGKLNVAGALAAVAELADVPTLLVDALPVPSPSGARLSRQGERITLLRLVLRAEGPEAIDVRQLGFRVHGQDPAAQLIVVQRAGTEISAQDPVLRSAPAPLVGDTITVTVAFGAGELRIAPGDSVQLLVGLEMGGGAPHAAAFVAFFSPAHTLAEGAVSGTPAALRQPGYAVAGSQVRTSLLLPGEALVLSENPIRSGRLILSFGGRPERVAAVYTLSGRRVVDLLPRIGPGDRRLEWDLTNDQGSAIAPGVYVLVFDVGSTIERRRLIVHRPAGN